jgi:hypothetical protein
MCKHANKSVVTGGILYITKFGGFSPGGFPLDKKNNLAFSLLHNAVAFKIIVGFSQRFSFF